MLRLTHQGQGSKLFGRASRFGGGGGGWTGGDARAETRPPWSTVHRDGVESWADAACGLATGRAVLYWEVIDEVAHGERER